MKNTSVLELLTLGFFQNRKSKTSMAFVLDDRKQFHKIFILVKDTCKSNLNKWGEVKNKSDKSDNKTDGQNNEGEAPKAFNLFGGNK